MAEYEEYLMRCKENMAKKILETKPNTFSILYRSGTITNKGLTGIFTEDISDYFKNRLLEGGIDITNEMDIRTSPLSWTVYFEVYNSLVQIEGSSISTNDLFNNNREDFIEPCKMEIIENIPMCLIDKFNIVQYPEWGEVVRFDYDKMKSEILDKYMNSGSKEMMKNSYKEIMDIMKEFPNKYNILSEKIIDLRMKKPIEITREEDRIINLRHTDGFQRLMHVKRKLDREEPEPNEEGVFILHNGRHVNGPNYDNWKKRRAEWIAKYKAWFHNIDHDYKLCFNALCEIHVMMLPFSSLESR